MKQMANHHSVVCHSERSEESLSLRPAVMDALLADIQIQELLQRTLSLGGN